MNSEVFLTKGDQTSYRMQWKKYFHIVQNVGCLGKEAYTRKGKDQGISAWGKHANTGGYRDEGS